jgi:hypothetical protein
MVLPGHRQKTRQKERMALGQDNALMFKMTEENVVTSACCFLPSPLTITMQIWEITKFPS